MAQLQYMPGDPRLVDQLVYELKSKGIFDQFRKECIADVDTRPAYQNLRQRVESSVTTFLTRQTWKADLNKNQLREKLRKHILDGNYLEQGVERIVDQVVNPKVSSVFIPQVEDLVYNYLGIPRKKTPQADATENADLLPTDLEAVSPGSVKSNDEEGKENKVQDMDIDSGDKIEMTEDMNIDTQKDDHDETASESASMDKSSIPLPSEEIKLENIPAPEHSPKAAKVELENIELPNESTEPVKVELNKIELPVEPNLSMDIPLPDEITMPREKDSSYFKPMALQSDDSNSSSSSSIRRNMSPITPVRNFDDDSCDAQQAFENNSSDNNHKEPSSFRFNIENKVATKSPDVKAEKKETDLSYQFTNQVNLNTYNTPMYDDSSNSHNLQIDYESDANTNISKNPEVKQEVENSEDIKKEKKDDKRSSNKSSHRSRDSSRHSSSKDKHSNSKDSNRHDKKTPSKDDKSKSSKEREKSKDRGDKKDTSKHRTSTKSSSSSKDKHRSSSSSHRHSSKSSDDRKSSKESSKDKPSDNSKERSSEKDKDRKDSSSRDRKDSKSRDSHRDKDRKSSKKDKKKDKKDIDDHYSLSGRGNHNRRSTDRDSNDGSSSSKGSQSHNNSKSTTDSKKESKSSKSENTSTSTSESTSPSDKGQILNSAMQSKPIIRVDKNLGTPIANPPRLPFVPDVTLRKPKFANNFEEAKKMMKMRKFLAEEQKRMNQEAALLLEFQANVRPSLSQVYSSIPGPELEFACVSHTEADKEIKENIETKEMKTEAVEIEKEKLKDIKTEGGIKFSLENEAEFEVKHVTKDIINDIIGVPSDEVPIENEVTELNTSLKNEDSKEKQLKPDEDYKNVKTTDTSIDKLEESIAEIVDQNMNAEVEITVAETLSEADVSEILEMKDENKVPPELRYFGEHEKYTAELERNKFGNFLKEYVEKYDIKSKMHLMNCDTYEENIFKEMAAKVGDFEIVNYYKNGHLVPSKNILNESSEISLPLESNEFEERSPIFSPVKSECSFELSSDYDAKLNEIVNKKSRQEVMEIILGGMIDESTTKMPTIDYYTEISDFENNMTIVEEVETVEEETKSSLKRRSSDEVNENRSVLTPNKIRKISDSEQISSTTEETEEVSNNNKIQPGTRSKFLGRAKRVGLPRPKRCSKFIHTPTAGHAEAVPNSPSSDKSVENYAQNTPTPNGKLKAPRHKVQRYDTSDLYKPKLHYLSRRNNIS